MNGNQLKCVGDGVVRGRGVGVDVGGGRMVFEIDIKDDGEGEMCR